MSRFDLETLKPQINPYISDSTLALDMLCYVYDITEQWEFFIEYNDKLYTRTGLICNHTNLKAQHISAKRWMYRDVFTNELDCIREHCGGLREELLHGIPQHTIIWGMSPQSVVALAMNMDKYFNMKLGEYLNIDLPGYFSLPAIFKMLNDRE